MAAVEKIRGKKTEGKREKILKTGHHALKSHIPLCTRYIID